MEITNEERREVAEKMRDEAQLWHEILPGTYINLGETSTLLQDIMYFVGIKGRAEPETMYNRLADLIDRPTCRKIIPSEIDGYVFCSNCGVEIGEYGVPNYCHNCGAEVQE